MTVTMLAGAPRTATRNREELTQETSTNSLGDLDELAAISCRRTTVSIDVVGWRKVGVGGSHTLLALVDELNAVLEELAGHVEDLLHCVRHCELLYWVLGKRKPNSRCSKEKGVVVGGKKVEVVVD